MDERSRVRGPGAWCALLLAGAAAGVLGGCAGGGRPVAGPGDSSGSPLPAELPHLGQRAALLYLVDRQLYEPVIVREGLAGPPELRRETARALGRIGDPAGLETLYSLLADEVPEVRREAVFALGEVAEAPRTAESARTRAAARLLEAVDDPDRDTGRLAVEALGKAGVAVEQVAAALAALPEEELRARLLPSLFHYPEEAAVPLAAEGLASEDPELHRWAAYALTRRPRPEALRWIRELTADPDPRVRAWAARAVGLVGGEGGTGPRDLALLRPLLDDRDGEAGPTVQALRAARALVADGRSAPDPGWRDPLLRLFADPRVGVRVTALDAASAWLLDEELGDALAAVAAGERPSSGGDGPSLEPPGPWERGAALVALATGGDSRAEDLAATSATSADP
ncbi:MAG: HEAT repeat domain-containing protein, partial [Thermoanaerobaculia bacterium]